MKNGMLFNLFPAWLMLCFCAAPLDGAAAKAASGKKIPVILDTDIGDDIDDTWALGMMLNSPELDVRLVVGDQGKAQYRAKLIAKFLEVAKRTDIPVGVGLDVSPKGGGAQGDWVKDYDLKKYPGKVHEDGVQAIIDVIMQSKEPVALIAIGPLPNIAAALEREPRIAQRARFIGMHGSVRLGYGGSQTISAEYNVRADAKACAMVLSAPWDVTITPLDTCGIITLKGAKYAKVRDAKSPTAVAVIENYRLWSSKNPKAPDTHSSTLFDTVAVYLAFSEELCVMEKLKIKVTDDGFTRIDPAGKEMNVATKWKDLGAFEDLLVQRVIGKE